MVAPSWVRVCVEHTQTQTSQGQSQLVGTTKKRQNQTKDPPKKSQKCLVCVCVCMRYMFNILIQPLFWEVVWTGGGVGEEWRKGGAGREDRHLTPIWQDAKLAAINYSAALSWSCAGAWHLNGVRIGIQIRTNTTMSVVSASMSI